MAQPDASLGLPMTLPPAARQGLLGAMQLGAPNDPERKVRFVKKAPGRRYFLGDVEQFQPPAGNLVLDRDGKPLNPKIRVEQTPDQKIEVDCGIEMSEASANEIPVGNFRPVKATVTLMSQEYAQIKGCRELEFNADRYGFGYELETVALFDQDFHTLIFFAINES